MDKNINKIEKFWRTVGGRKFVGFILATVLCVMGKISDQIWLATFMTYCTANVVQKIKGGGNNEKTN
jgi:hypothetical protein